MKSRYARILALLIAFSMIVQFNFGIQSFALDEGDGSETPAVHQEAPASSHSSETPKSSPAPAPAAKAEASAPAPKTEAPAPAKAEEPAPAKEDAPAKEVSSSDVSEKAEEPAPVKDEAPATEEASSDVPEKAEEPVPAKDEVPAAAEAVKEESPAKTEEPAAVSEETASSQSVSVQAAPKTALKAADKDEYHIHVVNIVNSRQIVKNPDGSVSLGSSEQSNVAGNTKTLNGRAAQNWSGGPGYKTDVHGVTYQFLNVYTVVDSETSDPVCIDEDAPLDLTTIEKVSYKGNDLLVLYLVDQGTGEKSTVEVNSNELYIAPVYRRTLNWFVDYYYNDNISTGSGSWSNKDAVSSFSHTFRNPETASPGITKDKYQFEYWQDEQTGEHFVDGDTQVYNSTWQPKGTRITYTINAYWQPAVAVNYMVEGVAATTARSFEEDVDVYGSYDGEDLNDDDNKFAGWYDEDSSRISEGEAYDLPEITCEADTYEEYDVTAMWQPSVTVRYNVLGVVDAVKNFEGVKVYDKSAEGKDGITFEGWYDEEGNRIDESKVYDAPALAADRNSSVLYNVFARFSTSRTVRKVWDDANNADGIRSGSVTVQLYANGEPTGKTITLNSANSWASEFADLDAYDADGNLIEYTINEEGVPSGYTARISVNGTDFTVTNVHVPAPVVPPTPAGPGGGGGPGGPGAPGGGPGAPAPAAAGTAVDDTPVPRTAPQSDLTDPTVPLAGAAWALINLICTAITVIISALLLIGYFGKKRDDDEDEAAEEDDEDKTKRKGALRLGSLIPAIGAVIAFILTEDMSLPMVLTDKWTLLMVVILIVQVVVAALSKKSRKDDENSDTPAEMQPTL